MWSIADVATKTISLLGVASVIGGIFSLFLARRLKAPAVQQVRTYMLVGSAVGFLATAAFFLSQIGAINQQGLIGMLDWQMGQILAQSSLGYSTGLRLGAFLLTLFTVQVFSARSDEQIGGFHLRASQILFTFVLAALASSFLLTGHVTSLGTAAHFAIALHVIAVFLWVGSLWPLHSFCSEGSQDIAALESAMMEFGKLAIVIVAVLISAGLFFLYSLLDSWREIVETPYGRGMLLKLTVVSALLLLGALNKFRLVPSLSGPAGNILLARSIKIEMVLASVILALTSYLTVVIGI